MEIVNESCIVNNFNRFVPMGDEEKDLLIELERNAIAVKKKS